MAWRGRAARSKGQAVEEDQAGDALEMAVEGEERTLLVEGLRGDEEVGRRDTLPSALELPAEPGGAAGDPGVVGQENHVQKRLLETVADGRCGAAADDFHPDGRAHGEVEEVF